MPPELDLDVVDKKLLTLAQEGLSLSTEPFRDLGIALGVSEEEVLSRLRRLKEGKVIRRIGGIFETRNLGFDSTLVAAQVPADRLEEVAAIIGSYPGVTHLYERDAELNLWFTLITRPEEKRSEVLAEIANRTGITAIHDLPTTRVFKIGVRLGMEGAE